MQRAALSLKMCNSYPKPTQELPQRCFYSRYYAREIVLIKTKISGIPEARYPHSQHERHRDGCQPEMIMPPWRLSAVATIRWRGLGRRPWFALSGRGSGLRASGHPVALRSEQCRPSSRKVTTDSTTRISPRSTKRSRWAALPAARSANHRAAGGAARRARARSVPGS